MVAGSGRDLPSASVAPVSDQMGVLVWPADQTLFVSTAADPKVRTIANGQFVPNYHHISPKAGAVAGRRHRVVWDLDDLL